MGIINNKKTNLLLIFISTFLVAIACFYFVQSKNDTQDIGYTSNSNNILSNSKPFFPFGLYYVDYNVPKNIKAKLKIKALNDIANAGFNIIHTSHSEKLDDDRIMLDQAKKLGVHVIIEGPAEIEVMNAFKTKSALLGWNIADDANSRYKRDTVLNRHNQVKKINPNYLTYISMFSLKPEVVMRFLHTSDLIGFQSYPISDRPLNSTFDDMKFLVNISQKYNAAPAIANLQTFKWNEPDSIGNPQRKPRFSEIRNMTYQALLGGVKGIIYFSYLYENWYLPEHQELWNGLKSLVPEIKVISPILLNGNLNQIDAGFKNILAGTWRNQNQVLAVIINTSYTDTTEVAIKVPANLSQAKSMFANRASGLVIRGDKLSGLIKPLDVHVYSLN
ncbi:hypothetical protein [Nostoc sp. MG11]|uniref:hypothetical protein n=1 Tax=Nostoc sp. MG11 TaxID=2721166 RepID=UPI00186644B5|nr:hypothetical protein [Nostoc sp. MG11]